MVTKKEIEIQLYVGRSIKEGRYEEIAVPEQRSPDTWVALDTQHSNERTRGRNLQMVTPRSPYVATVLKPATGVIAALAVDPPQASVLKGFDEAAPVETQTAAELAVHFSNELQTNKKCDLAIATALQSNATVTYEDLIPIAGAVGLVKDSLRRLRQFKNIGLKIQTIDTLVVIEPAEIMIRSLPSAVTVKLNISYLGLSSAQRGDNFVVLAIASDNALSLNEFFQNQAHVKARLNTINNLIGLKLLQAAQLMELDVECVMGKEFDLRSQKWVYTVTDVVDTANLIDRLGRVGEAIRDTFGC
jgi:hypothetical protein